ncbi:MAG: Hsp20/alpha crystallin family protein [Pyrobaculum sp.]
MAPGDIWRRRMPCRGCDTQQDNIVDVIDYGDKIVVTMELPGARDIAVNVFRDLFVESDGRKRYEIGLRDLLIVSDGRRYYEIKLPDTVEPDGARTTYKNGVLSVELPKKKKWFKIRID